MLPQEQLRQRIIEVFDTSGVFYRDTTLSNEILDLYQVGTLFQEHAFRDDSHISAWAPYGVNGHTWETFSFVWNGEANTVEKLAERLPYRNYTAEDYTKTLTDLTQRGWIEPSADGYKATAEGKKIRKEAEDKTNENHFSPWKVLTDDELVKLGELLNELKETNIKIVEEIKAN